MYIMSAKKWPSILTAQLEKHGIKSFFSGRLAKAGDAFSQKINLHLHYLQPANCIGRLQFCLSFYERIILGDFNTAPNFKSVVKTNIILWKRWKKTKKSESDFVYHKRTDWEEKNILRCPVNLLPQSPPPSVLFLRINTPSMSLSAFQIFLLLLWRNFILRKRDFFPRSSRKTLNTPDRKNTPFESTSVEIWKNAELQLTHQHKSSWSK